MKFTVADLLDQLSIDAAVEPPKLAKSLKLTKQSEKQCLDLALDALGRIGVVAIQDDGGVIRCENDQLIDARLRCSSKGFCFAIRHDGGDDIYIRDHQLNHAWNGDRVLVRITREGGRRRSPEGGVQCILERSTTSLLAQVERQDEQLVAVPLDDRLLASIQLPKEAGEHLQEDKPTSVVEVQVDRYPVAQHAAVGHVARPLPLNGGPAADRELLLTKAGLHHRQAAPRGSAKAPATKGRTDLSDQPCLLLRSWSVEDAPGLPAVHVEAHEGGSRLWVHAPTVAERIGSGNSLDLWLRDQGEALCLGNAWQPLLTPALSKAGSFVSGETAEAITVRLDVSATGEITDWTFMLSTIRPAATVSSEQMKALAERKPRSRSLPTALKPIKDHLGQLETLQFCARCLMDRERQAGVVQLDLQLPEMEALGDMIWADPTGLRHRWVDAMAPQDPQSLLQPLLRAANRAWAQHRESLQLPGIVLQSGEPDPAVLTDVAKTAIALDLPLELDEEGSPSAQELLAGFSESAHRRVLEQQLSHALPQPAFAVAGLAPVPTEAEESTASATGGEKATDPLVAEVPWCCAGLSYVHLANQQVLVSLLQDGKDRPTVRHKTRLTLGERGCGEALSWPLFTASQEEKLQGICTERFVQRLNSRRRQIHELERDLVTMVQARSAEPLVDSETEGRISGVQSYGFFVEVGPTRVEGLVHVSSLNDDWYEYRSRQNRLVGRKTRRVYQLGDSVRVRVIKVDVLRNQIDLDVIADPLPAPEAEDTGITPIPVTLSNA